VTRQQHMGYQLRISAWPGGNVLKYVRVFCWQ